MMKFEVIRSENIKPSSPTPHYLKHFKLSLLDQLAPVAYEPLVLFYPYNDRDVTFTPAKRSLWMKKSLSETLTRFYPFAGRIKENISIECFDDGVDYVEARVHGLLSTLLAQPDAEALRQLLPVEIESPKAGTGPLLLVQENFFDCGGLAIGVCMSRKLGDAASLSTFIMSWAASALGFSQALLPDFNASFRFPPMDCSSGHNSAVDHIIEKRTNGCVTKRFVFYASKIGALQTKAASANVKQPTHSEAVTALIWRCAVAAASRSSLLHKFPPKLSVLSQSVDIRKRVVPPLSDDSIGNLVGYFAAQAKESELELQGLVAQLRKGLNEASNYCAERLKGSDGSRVIIESFKESDDFIHRDDIMNFHVCTGLSDYKLLYEVNFGWGRPIWVSNIPSGLNRNVASLVSTREDDGTEAWVTLSEGDMETFEQNQELLAFAVVNPSVLEPIALKSAL
ncbi:BAHD acyltransferase At5g47980-like [Rosa rugosa]|uniref:BAHD acyltransferase At5g47980-like n=1 Tax=Rosa rugosa TaxID=74645 RepID=UPI002B41151A|nr:BAHD acyltransferase At5g47980-like [Rosa rugosa]